LLPWIKWETPLNRILSPLLKYFRIQEEESAARFTSKAAYRSKLQTDIPMK
jgi:hypothetical protein